MKLMLAAAALLVLPQTAAQGRTPDRRAGVKIVATDYTATNKGANFVVTIDPTEMRIDARTMVTLTPMLRSRDGVRQHRFHSVVLARPARYRVTERAISYGDFAFEREPLVFAKHRRANPQMIPLRFEVPFEKWMRDAELVVVERHSGCAGCDIRERDRTHFVAELEFPAPFRPEFEVSYITPDVEPVKVRSDSYTARLSFRANKSDLQGGFGNNAAVLSEADKVMSELKNDPLLAISAINVRGYASPEGSATGNRRLSEDRARSFVNYLSTRHNLSSTNVAIRSTGMGEDWDGLHKAVSEALYLYDRQAILDIIDGVDDIAKRKNAIRTLSGGRTYRTLLEDIYPALRRNEYTIEYTVRSFNAEEAARIYGVRPQLLSLNELFMVATGYPAGSEEFKQVFDFASRMYPDSPAAQFNTAALEVENGAFHSAIDRLKEFDTPQAWNNMGIAYWRLGEYETAGELFAQAARGGSPEGERNLEQYRRWDEER